MPLINIGLLINNFDRALATRGAVLVSLIEIKYL